MNSFQDFKNLESLLSQGDDGGDESVAEKGGSAETMHPGMIGPSSASHVSTSSSSSKSHNLVVKSASEQSAVTVDGDGNPVVAADPLDIWQPEEIEMDDLLEVWDSRDARKEPDYDILYKQDVSAEDVYMNMGMKDASTQYADGIVVKIKLPGAEMKDVVLDVTRDKLRCETSRYRLFLHLPHKVRDDKGTAKWLSEEDTLKVTLPISEDDELIC